MFEKLYVLVEVHGLEMTVHNPVDSEAKAHDLFAEASGYERPYDFGDGTFVDPVDEAWKTSGCAG